eukprot:331354-Amphidinium_carterae.1
MVAVDSQEVVYCLKKGRSCSKALNQVMQSAFGNISSTGVRLCPIWVATECNPADAPTRSGGSHIHRPPADSFSSGGRWS